MAKFHDIDMVGPIKVERLSSLPTWDSSYIGRVVFVTGEGQKYIGSNYGWVSHNSGVIDSQGFSDLKSCIENFKNEKKTIQVTQDDNSLTSSLAAGTYTGITVKVLKGVTVTLNGISTINFNIEVEDGGQVVLDQDVTVNGNLESKGNTSGVVAFDANTGDETLTCNYIISGPWKSIDDNLTVSYNNYGISTETSTVATSAYDINGVTPVYDKNKVLLGYIPIYDNYS